jgi:hypothetical protein
MPSVPFDNVLPDAGWQRLIAGDAFDHRRDFALPQPVDGERSYVRPSNPRWLKFRSVGNDQQHPQCSDFVHGSTERFQARWVDPMHVLKNH